MKTAIDLTGILAEKRKALAVAENDEVLLGEVPLLQLQITALDRAAIRLRTKINPPMLINQWCIDNVPNKNGMVIPEPVRIYDEVLSRSLPNQLLYIVRFRQYPVARMVPEPLTANNIFAVSSTGQVVLITTEQEQLKFFTDNLAIILPGILDTRSMFIDALYSWLRTAEELVQDGMFRFTIAYDKINLKEYEAAKGAAGIEGAAWVASGEALVEATAGNSGAITASMIFNAEGKLLSVEQNIAVKHGIRPICQATKLLDPDPVVRRMAEQDLLFMGRDAESYIMEQHALANPELQAAIDKMWAKIVAQK